MDSLSAYDSTATTVLLQASVADSTASYYYITSQGCSEASLFQVFGQLSPGTERRFGIYDDFRCFYSSLKATSNLITTKQLTLASSNVTGSGATLSVSGWTHTKDGLTRDGDWHYKADKGPDAVCSAGQTGNSVTLTGLDSATAYTYTMYRDSKCVTAFDAFPSFTTTGRAMTVATGATTAALTIPGYTSTWYYKHDGVNCRSASSGATGYVTGLARNTEYRFKAYGNSGCSTEIAGKRASTQNPALAASGISKNGATLALSGWIVGTGDGKDGAWHYKASAGPDSAACSTAQTGDSVALTGLTGDNRVCLHGLQRQRLHGGHHRAAVLHHGPHPNRRRRQRHHHAADPFRLQRRLVLQVHHYGHDHLRRPGQRQPRGNLQQAGRRPEQVTPPTPSPPTATAPAPRRWTPPRPRPPWTRSSPPPTSPTSAPPSPFPAGRPPTTAPGGTSTATPARSARPTTLRACPAPASPSPTWTAPPATPSPPTATALALPATSWTRPRNSPPPRPRPPCSPPRSRPPPSS